MIQSPGVVRVFFEKAGRGRPTRRTYGATTSRSRGSGAEHARSRPSTERVPPPSNIRGPRDRPKLVLSYCEIRRSG